MRSIKPNATRTTKNRDIEEEKQEKNPARSKPSGLNSNTALRVWRCVSPFISLLLSRATAPPPAPRPHALSRDDALSMVIRLRPAIYKHPSRPSLLREKILSVKTQRAPSRHYIGMRFRSSMTTACKNHEYTPPLPINTKH